MEKPRTGELQNEILIHAGTEVEVAQADLKAAAGRRIGSCVEGEGCGGRADDGKLLQVGEHGAVPGRRRDVGRYASVGMASESWMPSASAQSLAKATL